jgi:hypothetical protein
VGEKGVQANTIQGKSAYKIVEPGKPSSSIGISQGGVGLESSSTYIHNISVPGWLARLLRFDEEGIGKFLGLPVSEKPDWNLLVSLSWRVVRSRRARGLVPDGVFVRYVESEVARLLRFGRWVKVVAGPRTGKSTGVVRGVVKWLVENDMKNYVVLVVAANRRLAENLYRYVIGAVVSLFHELRRSGIKISRGELFSKVRVRLYIGSEQSCLLGKRVHYVEDCVKRCTLFKRYERGWRRLPPAPVMDTWVLKLAGYCPFISASSKSFWYKSIVVLTYNSLGYALRQIARHKIRRVILVLDEWLFLADKLRGVLVILDAKKLKRVFGELFEREFDVDSGGDVRVSVAKIVNAWNRLVSEIDELLVRFYAELLGVEYHGLKLATALADALFLPRDDVSTNSDIYDRLLALYRLSEVAIELAKRIADVDGRMKLLRLGYWMRDNVMKLFHAVEEGERRFSLVLRWNVGRKGEHLRGYYGSGARGIVQMLRRAGIDVATVTTSVDELEALGVRILVHEALESVEVRLDKVMKLVRSEKVKLRLRGLLSPSTRRDVLISLADVERVVREVVRFEGNAVIVVSKRLMRIVVGLLQEIGLSIEVHGDTERGVIDYVLARKRGGVVMVVSPHSRVAMGVDPPVDDPKIIVIMYGLRRPAQSYIKVPHWVLSRLVVRDPELSVFDYSVYKEGNAYFVSDGERLWLYDRFDARFDIHMLTQVIGRWYMHNVNLIVFNSKYDLYDIRYYAVDVDWVYSLPSAPYYVMSDVEKRKGYAVRKLIPVHSFDDAVHLVIDVNRSTRYERTKELMGSAYRGLRGVYNSLRYARKQLKYRRLRRDELWWLAKKVASMMNGFEYAHMRGLDVPIGLKRFYRRWLDEGIYGLLEELKMWLGLPDQDYYELVKLLAFAYNVRALRGLAEFLEFRRRPRRERKKIVFVDEVEDERRMFGKLDRWVSAKYT